MCGIAGAAGEDSGELVRTMLEAITHRGPDGTGTYSSSTVTLGTAMLHITGKKSQPVHNDGALTYNGEVYNFQEMAEKLGIVSDSDTEVLFHFIRSRGVEAAVHEIDGDYAFAYAENDRLTLVRDPIGVKPLYYAKSDALFGFASEKKGLSAAGFGTICSLRPGHLLTSTGGSLMEKKVMGLPSGERLTDEEAASKMLYEAIDRAVKKRTYKPCAVAFSGGLDSSLIAAQCPDAQLYSVGMARSHDIQQVKRAAHLLGLEHNLRLQELTEDEVESALPEVIRAIESRDPLMVGIAMPLFLASKHAHSDGIRVMLSGQGADELFAGYKRYESVPPNMLERELQNDLARIAEKNLERDDAVTMAHAVELRVPYLDRGVVELALRIAPALKIHRAQRKYVLRLAAEKILPRELAWKEKKAAQYSSGIHRAMEKIAKKNGYTGKGFLLRYLEAL